jgi:lysophospholipase L1-like esterase
VTAAATGPRTHGERRIKLIVAVTSTLVTLLLGEGLLRIYYRPTLDERNLTYRYDAALGWLPVPNSSRRFVGTRPISVHHNSRGFRDHELGTKQKPRIVVIGDSFVWGYDAEVEERFTDQLQQLMPEWEVVNMGVSGYGTDQELLLARQVLAEYQPDIVFLMFCSHNDEEDNSSNRRYGGYYKPYFIKQGSRLQLAGVPVPKSQNFYYSRSALLRGSRFAAGALALAIRIAHPPIQVENPTVELLAEFKRLSVSQKAKFVIGTTDASAHVEGFCLAEQVPCVNLATNLRYASEEYGHWTPEGNRWVAERVQGFLRERKLIASH